MSISISSGMTKRFRAFQRLPAMGLLDLAYLAAAQALMGNGPAARLAYGRIEQSSGSSIVEVLPACALISMRSNSTICSAA